MVKIPENYTPSLGLYETQKAIGLIKNVFLVKICAALHLKRVTAPLFVDPSTGLNDDLNGARSSLTFRQSAATRRWCIPLQSGSALRCMITAFTWATALWRT
mgnify:CR=1 FL=1